MTAPTASTTQDRGTPQDSAERFSRWISGGAADALPLPGSGATL
ncbi:hypothetical protein [Streptomyces sp. NPDC055954]